MRHLRLRAFACSVAVASLALAATGAQAGQIITAVGSETIGPNPVNVDRVSTSAGGAVSYADAGVTAKAMTDFGVNRIYNSAAAGTNMIEGYASSVWAETFTAQGTGTVNLKFNFTIDGSVAYGLSGNSHAFNYVVSALKGAWSLSAQGGYDELKATLPTQTQEMVNGQARNFSGERSIYLSTPTNTVRYDATSPEGTTVQRDVTREGSKITIHNVTTNPGSSSQSVFTETGFAANGQTEIPWANLPLVPRTNLQTAYQTNLTNFPILAQSSLCTGYSIAGMYEGCAPGDYPPTTLTLEFNLDAGTSFTLVSALMSRNAENGTVDFYNTVRLNDIVVTGGTVTSDNPQFQSLGNGTFGFSAAAASDVPEPASWAMMTIGFGAVGAAVRRRRKAVACLA